TGPATRLGCPTERMSKKFLSSRPEKVRAARAWRRRVDAAELYSAIQRKDELGSPPRPTHPFIRRPAVERMNEFLKASISQSLWRRRRCVGGDRSNSRPISAPSRRGGGSSAPSAQRVGSNGARSRQEGGGLLRRHSHQSLSRPSCQP